MEKKIVLEHGSGAKKTRELIAEVFVNKFNDTKTIDEDAALIYNDKLAFTTDSFVISPEFFAGGNIGKLAVCGTANDLTVRGARPCWLSSSYIISEGYSIDKLDIITDSMAKAAKNAGIAIVTGDTKVIDQKDFNGIIINTSGVGEVINATSIKNIQRGDVIIISGSLGDHSATILAAREGLYLDSPIESDCAILYPMLKDIIKNNIAGFIRDITRGGLTSILYEINVATGLGIEIEEKNIPVKPAVHELCDIMGLDYLGMANEGKVLLCVKPEQTKAVLDSLNASEFGKDAAIIGIITDKHNKVLLHDIQEQTIVLQEHTNIPRIC